MNKKLLLVIWIVGLIFSTGFTSVSAASNTASNNQVSLVSTDKIQVLWTITNRSKSTAIFALESSQPYFSSITYVAGGAKTTRFVTLSPGKYSVWVSFYDHRCKFIKKNFKVTKNTKRITISVTCGKF